MNQQVVDGVSAGILDEDRSVSGQGTILWKSLYAGATTLWRVWISQEDLFQGQESLQERQVLNDHRKRPFWGQHLPHLRFLEALC